MSFDKRKYIKRIFDHLKSVDIDSLIDSLYNDVESEEFESINVDGFSDLKSQCQCNDVRSGMTKIVMLYDDMPDYVIKIPLFGFDLWSCGLDLSSGGLEWFDRVEFNGVSKDDIASSNRKNYCEKECCLYKKAEDSGLAKFFAKTEYAFSIKGMIPVYMSERCDSVPCVSDPRVDSSEGMRYANHMNFARFAIPGSVVDTLMEENTQQDLDRLYKFLKEQWVYDLHGENWGVDKSGKLKIIDYSGFCENLESYNEE